MYIYHDIYVYIYDVIKDGYLKWRCIQLVVVFEIQSLAFMSLINSPAGDIEVDPVGSGKWKQVIN